MFEILQKNIQILEEGLTIKSDYTEELEKLDGYESDIAVFRYQNSPTWKCNDLLKQIRSIREWIKEEMAYK